MSGRCSPTEALALLAPELSPMAAAEEITRAIRNNKCRVRCDNDVIKPHIAAIARVVPKLENDARWIADIESTGPGLGWPRGLNWKLEIDEVIALKPQPDAKAEAMQTAAATDNPQRRRPGPKPTHPDWRLEVAVETHRLRKKLRRAPSAGELAEFCQNKWEWEPDESDIRELLRFLLRE